MEPLRWIIYDPLRLQEDICCKRITETMIFVISNLLEKLSEWVSFDELNIWGAGGCGGSWPRT
jgi:hypothetical protein